MTDAERVATISDVIGDCVCPEELHDPDCAFCAVERLVGEVREACAAVFDGLLAEHRRSKAEMISRGEKINELLWARDADNLRFVAELIRSMNR